jgi:cell division protein FtsI/penicillin-binding protein 2
MPQPRIVEKITSNNIVLYQHKPSMLGNLVTTHTARKLTAMLKLTTREGTASRYFKHASPTLQYIEVAGKTGSLSSESPDGVRRHNSWFIGFAPADDPEIAIAVLVVNDPKWRIKGSMLARKMLETFFEMPRTPPASVSGKLPR